MIGSENIDRKLIRLNGPAQIFTNLNKDNLEFYSFEHTLESIYKAKCSHRINSLSFLVLCLDKHFNS